MKSELYQRVIASHCAQTVRQELNQWERYSSDNGISLERAAFSTRHRNGSILGYSLEDLGSNLLGSGMSGTLLCAAAMPDDFLHWYCGCDLGKNTFLEAFASRDSPDAIHVFLRGIAIGQIVRTTPEPETFWKKLSTAVSRHSVNYEVICCDQPFGNFQVTYPLSSTAALLHLELTDGRRLPLTASQQTGHDLSIAAGDVPDADHVVPARSEALSQPQLFLYGMINMLLRVQICALDFSGS